MRLRIPRETAEILARELTVESRRTIAQSLPNDAWASLAAIVRLGAEQAAWPEDEFSTADVVAAVMRMNDECRRDPYRARHDLTAKDLRFRDYLLRGLQIVDAAGVRFVGLREYWDNGTEPTPAMLQRPVSGRATAYEGGSREEHETANLFTHVTPVTPTAEQELFLAAAAENGPAGVLKSEALAGTGKTTLCTFVGRELQGRSLIYLAFNRQMAVEAQARHGHLMKCRTTDSLAYSVVRPTQIWGEERLKKTPVNWLELADMLGLPLEFGGFRRGPLIRLLHQSVMNYCNSADLEIGDQHIAAAPWPIGSDLQVLAWARALWERMVAVESRLPILPPMVMKWWQLRGGAIPHDVVVFDEAQDAAPSFLNILQRWGGLLLAIGDPHQQLYAWRGAVDSMLQLPGQAYPLTQSWRFGHEIAAFANATLLRKSRAPEHLVIGNAGIASRVKIWEPHRLPEWPITILSRTNAQVFRHAVDIAQRGHKLHVVGNIDELRWLLQDALKLFLGEPGKVTHWRLACFPNWTSLTSEADLTADLELRRIQEIVESSHDTLNRQLEVLQRQHEVDPTRASAILSTTHKVKGREWDRVMLANDFYCGHDLARLPAERQDAELNVIYVASTRAKRELYMAPELAETFQAALR